VSGEGHELHHSIAPSARERGEIGESPTQIVEMRVRRGKRGPPSSAAHAEGLLSGRYGVRPHERAATQILLPCLLRFVRLSVRLHDRESNSQGWAAVAVAPDLGVALAESDRQSLYLRTFFRLLSSWVHHKASSAVPIRR